MVEELIEKAFTVLFAIKMGVPKAIFNMGINIWNALVDEGLVYIQNNPSSFAQGKPYSYIVGINKVMIDFAIPLCMLFFMWGLFNEGVNVREEMTGFNVIKILVRLSVAEYFVTHNLSLLNDFISIFTGINSKIIGKVNIKRLHFSQVKLADPKASNFKPTDLMPTQVFLIVFSVVVFVVLTVCAVMILYTIFTKYLNILVLMPFSCLAFSTMSAANHEFHNMSLSYIKHFLATVGELVAVVIILILMGSVVSTLNSTLIKNIASVLSSGTLSWTSNYIATGVCYCLMASLCVGMIKGTSAIMQKVFS